jgi:hypothetical protein
VVGNRRIVGGGAPAAAVPLQAKRSGASRPSVHRGNAKISNNFEIRWVSICLEFKVTSLQFAQGCVLFFLPFKIESRASKETANQFINKLPQAKKHLSGGMIP